MSKIIHVDVLNNTFKTTKITDFTDIVGIEKDNLFIRAAQFNSPSALYIQKEFNVTLKIFEP